MNDPTPQANPVSEALLEQLRDLASPDPTSWWPPAPGWWALASALLVAIYFGLRFIRLRRRRLEYRKEAGRELIRIRARWNADHDTAAYASAAHQLVRRVAIHMAGQRRVARLTGSAFIECANRLSKRTLSEDASVLLTQATYRPRSEFDVARVHPEIEAWIEALEEPERA